MVFDKGGKKTMELYVWRQKLTGLAPYKMPDSFTIVQWDEDAYRTVTMKRMILWAQEWFAEVFFVDGIPQGKTADG